MVAVEMAEPEELDWMRVLSGERPARPRLRAGGRPRRRAAARGPSSAAASRCSPRSAARPRPSSGSGELLFWEDIGEENYRLDRMLTQLERSGTFDRLQGMIIGSVVSRDRTEPADDAREYLRDRFRGAPFPVAVGFPAGHRPRPADPAARTPRRCSTSSLAGASHVPGTGR